jgi:hypothetical protein
MLKLYKKCFGLTVLTLIDLIHILSIVRNIWCKDTNYLKIDFVIRENQNFVVYSRYIHICSHMGC